MKFGTKLIYNGYEIVKLAKEYNLLVIADNTFMSPFLQRPLELGCDIVVHSATKFLNGHSDVVADLVVAKNKELAIEYILFKMPLVRYLDLRIHG